MVLASILANLDIVDDDSLGFHIKDELSNAVKWLHKLIFIFGFLVKRLFLWR